MTNSSLEKAIQNKTATVGVIGLGYVGLPLIRAFIAGGMKTMGFDVDRAKVDQLLAGRSYIKHIPAEWIAQYVADKRFVPTADMRRLGEPDALLICVPTPLNDSRDPDLTYIEQTAQQIAAALRPGQLIVLESTTYPGTTRDVVLPILQKRGLAAGRDFFLAFSPEREDPGNPNYTAERIPKVVGGIDAASGRLAQLLYGQAMAQVVPVSNCEIAEAAKILENTYRSVNIALVNELKVLFTRMGIDVWEVIDAARTKPFGFQAFYPGPGLGGHCIPIDPFYLSWKTKQAGIEARFIDLAGYINGQMPHFVVDKIQNALNDHSKPLKGSHIHILGVAYKRNIDDVRESPALDIILLLERRGARVTYSDPFVPNVRLDHRELTAEDALAMSSSADCVVVVTDHASFDYAAIVERAHLIVDTRNALKNYPLAKVVRL